jgi:hypothetical protein
LDSTEKGSVNGQYNVAKKNNLEVIIKTHLPVTGFLLVIFATKKIIY